MPKISSLVLYTTICALFIAGANSQTCASPSQYYHDSDGVCRDYCYDDTHGEYFDFTNVQKRCAECSNRCFGCTFVFDGTTATDTCIRCSYYRRDEPECTSSRSGSDNDNYNVDVGTTIVSRLLDINQNTRSSNIEIILRNDGSESPHYWSSGASTGALTQILRGVYADITIRPKYQSDSCCSRYPFNEGGGKATVYIENEDYQLFISNKITIKDINFVSIIATPGAFSYDVAYEGIIGGGLAEENLDQQWGGFFNLEWNPKLATNVDSAHFPELEFINVGLQDYYPYQLHTRAFIKFSQAATITLTSFDAQNYYFPGGLITNYFNLGKWGKSQDDSGEITRPCYEVSGYEAFEYCLTLTIDGTSSFSGFNDVGYTRDVVISDSYEPSYYEVAEAYTLHAYAIHSHITISGDVTFENARPSVSSSSDAELLTCKSELWKESPYIDILDSDSGEKAAIDKIFKLDGVYSKFSSSHFLFYKFSGKISVDGATFQNNIGYNGVGFNIQSFWPRQTIQVLGTDYQHEDPDNPGTYFFELGSQIEFSSSDFIDNFALISGAAMQIKSSTNLDSYQYHDDCRNIHLYQNTFQGNTGCPTAFAPVMIGCFFKGKDDNNYSPEKVQLYLDSDYDSDEDLVKRQFRTQYTNANDGLTLSKTRIEENTFQANRGLVSNGLYIYGAKDVELIRNDFINNGVILPSATTDEYTGNFYDTTYGQIPEFPDDEEFMLEASSSMISYAVHLTILENTFNGNWGFTTGDSYLGSSLAIRRHMLTDILHFDTNTFQNHVGAPTAIAPDNSKATLPAASLQILSGDDTEHWEVAAEIHFSDNTFEDNEYEMDLSNNDITDKLKVDRYTLNNPRGASSLFKYYFKNEESASPPSSKDYSSGHVNKIRVFFDGENIHNNIHNSGGCLFEIGPYESFIRNMHLTENEIYRGDDDLMYSYFCFPHPTAMIEDIVNPIEFISVTFEDNTGRYLYADSPKFSFLFSDVNVEGQVTDEELIRCDNTPKFTMAYSTIKESHSTSSMSMIHLVNSYDVYFYVDTLVSTNSSLLSADKCPQIVMKDIRGRGGVIDGASFIFLRRSSIDITEGDFKETEGADGSVLQIQENSFARITNSIFESNRAQNGGVAYIEIDSSLELIGNEFIGNSATDNYGCIAQFGGTSTIQKNYFEGCSSRNVGAIYLERTEADISENRFLSNEATHEAAGALYLFDNVVTFKNNVVQGTVSEEVTLFSNKNTMTISDSRFYANTATKKTKGIFAFQSDLTILNTEFEDNTEAGRNYGAFLRTFDSVVTIEGSSFKNGNALFGGAFAFEQVTDVTITDCDFDGNYATYDGGVIYSLALALRIESSTFHGNSAGGLGSDVFANNNKILSSKSNTFTGVTGTAIFTQQTNTIQINSTTMTGEDDPQAPTQGVRAIDFQNFFAQNNEFYNFNGVKGGALALENDRDLLANVTLKNDLYESNNALLGGGAYIFGNMDADVKGCKFSKNVAVYDLQKQYDTGNGGGLLWDSDTNYTNASIQFSEGTEFYANNAEKAGGGLKWDNNEIIMDEDTEFRDNTAIYGEHIASHGVYLYKIASNYSEDVIDERINFQCVVCEEECFLTGDSERAGCGFCCRYVETFDESTGGIFRGLDGVGTELQQVPSGQSYEIVFAIVDHYGQIVKTDDKSTFSLVATSEFGNGEKIAILEENSAAADEGIFRLSNFKITLEPGASYSLGLQTNAIPERIQIELSDSASTSTRNNGRSLVEVTTELTNSLQIQLRECQLGEVLSVDRKCVPCPPGEYSVVQNIKNTEDAECETCQDNAVCLGGDSMGPKRGYWRENPASSNFIRCPNQDACIGYTTGDYDEFMSATGLCAEGYDGKLCFQCAEGFAKDKNSNCIDCDNNVKYWVLTGFAIAIAIGMFYYFARKNIKEMNSQKQFDSTILKIILNFFHYILIISSFEFYWPNWLNDFFEVQNRIVIAPSEIFYLDCLYLKIWPNIRPYFIQSAIIELFPVIMYFFIWLYWNVHYQVKKGSKAYQSLLISEKNEKINVAAYSVLFLIYPSLFYFSFRIWDCTNLGDDVNPKYYLIADPELECYTTEHILWAMPLGIFAAIFYALIVPYLIWRSLKRAKNLGKNGWLRHGYETNRMYWELVVTARKLLLVFCGIFFRGASIMFRGSFLLLIFMLAYVVQEKSKPYVRYDLNQLEKKSLTATFLILYLGLLFIADDDGSRSFIVWVIGIVVGLYYFYFILLIISKFFEQTLKSLDEKTNTPKVLKCLPYLKRFGALKVWATEKEDKIMQKLDKEFQEKEQEMKAQLEGSPTTGTSTQRKPTSVGLTKSLAIKTANRFAGYMTTMNDDDGLDNMNEVHQQYTKLVAKDDFLKNKLEMKEKKELFEKGSSDDEFDYEDSIKLGDGSKILQSQVTNNSSLAHIRKKSRSNTRHQSIFNPILEDCATPQDRIKLLYNPSPKNSETDSPHQNKLQGFAEYAKSLSRFSQISPNKSQPKDEVDLPDEVKSFLPSELFATEASPFRDLARQSTLSTRKGATKKFDFSLAKLESDEPQTVKNSHGAMSSMQSGVAKRSKNRGVTWAEDVGQTDDFRNLKSKPSIDSKPLQLIELDEDEEEEGKTESENMHFKGQSSSTGSQKIKLPLNKDQEFKDDKDGNVGAMTPGTNKSRLTMIQKVDLQDFSDGVEEEEISMEENQNAAD